jgi:hypothetical protein
MEPNQLQSRRVFMTCNRRARVAIAAIATALVGGLSAACTSEPQGTVESGALSEPVSESTAPPGDADRRTPVATVLFSGRIAFPNITLTTWGTCPFVIDRVRRLDPSTMLVYGNESKSACESTDSRHVATKRPKGTHAIGGEDVERVIVVSEQPSYGVEARVRRVVA